MFVLCVGLRSVATAANVALAVHQRLVFVIVKCRQIWM